MPKPVLAAADIQHFVERGFVRVRDCFSEQLAREWTEGACERLFCSLADRSTWPLGRVRAPESRRRPMCDVAPRAWQAACELCGGPERVNPNTTWGNGFLINFGGENLEQWVPPSSTVRPDEVWHKDGDFFRHFLDSPEQGLLIVAVFSDLTSGGGGTYLACDSVAHVARFLAARPEGVEPRGFPEDEIVANCSDFLEVTGQVGDVFLLHPFMLHSWSINAQSRARFMINPPVALREPMCFSRADLATHSPIEQAVLRALGLASFSFQATGARERIVPERIELEQKVWDDRARQAENGGTAFQ